MSLAEQFVLSLTEEHATVHLLLWDDQEDLIRALIVVLAAVSDRGVLPLLVSSASADLLNLQQQVRNRYAVDAVIQEPENIDRLERLWLLFIQQGTSMDVGPWLNGYRRPLAQAGGTLVVVREAELGTFQRAAPDLASFVGPRIYNASSMLFAVSEAVYERLSPIVPPEIETILLQLPGRRPSQESLGEWVRSINSLPS